MTLIEKTNTPMGAFQHYCQAIQFHEEIQLCKETLEEMERTKDLKEYDDVLSTLDALVEHFLNIIH